MQDENEDEKFQSNFKLLMAVIITAFITFMVTLAVVTHHYTGGNSDNIVILDEDFNNSQTMTSLSAIKGIIDKYYIGEQNEQQMEEGAIKGFVEGLGDPYSEYITSSELEEFNIQIMGNYVGIGVYMTINTEYNLIQVLAPIPQSPAHEAGILPGDFIKSVDGVEYTADDMTTASNKIKGQEGTKVKLTVIRDGKELEFELTRKTVVTNPINGEVLENDIGYLEVTSFDEGTAEEFKNKFKDLQKSGIKSLIIDLRNNGGGIVSEAIDIADCIVEKGENLLITVDKNGEEEITKAKEKPIINIPIIVLVNENSASASEILAGALKDLNKATIVGTNTYGKGLIQRIIPLTDGQESRGALKLTIQEYFTPNRNKINEIGIEPNITVELPEDLKNTLFIERENDTQLNKAIEILKNR